MYLQYFSLLHSVQTYRMGTGGNRLGREADNSTPSSAEVKKVGAIPPFPHVSME
jgi:hypothetical protein